MATFLIGSKPSAYSTKGLRFNGVDELVERDNPAMASHTGARSLSMFVRVNSFINATSGVNSADTFACVGDQDTLAYSAAFNFNLRGRVGYPGVRWGWTMRQRGGGAFRPTNGMISTSSVALDTWYHLVWQNTGSSNRLLVNGVIDPLINWTGSNPGNWTGDLGFLTPNKLTFGRIWGSSGYNGGAHMDIDEVTYWNGAITPAEAATMQVAGKPVDPNTLDFSAGSGSTLLLHWPFGEAAVPPTVPAATGGEDLTMVNMDSSNVINVP